MTPPLPKLPPPPLWLLLADPPEALLTTSEDVLLRLRRWRWRTSPGGAWGQPWHGQRPGGGWVETLCPHQLPVQPQVATICTQDKGGPSHMRPPRRRATLASPRVVCRYHRRTGADHVGNFGHAALRLVFRVPPGSVQREYRRWVRFVHRRWVRSVRHRSGSLPLHGSLRRRDRGRVQVHREHRLFHAYK